jgi:hypothetical protein
VAIRGRAGCFGAPCTPRTDRRSARHAAPRRVSARPPAPAFPPAPISVGRACRRIARREVPAGGHDDLVAGDADLLDAHPMAQRPRAASVSPQTEPQTMTLILSDSGWASRRRTWAGCSIPSSPPSRWAGGTGSACRSATASSSSTAASRALAMRRSAARCSSWCWRVRRTQAEPLAGAERHPAQPSRNAARSCSPSSGRSPNGSAGLFPFTIASTRALTAPIPFGWL